MKCSDKIFSKLSYFVVVNMLRILFLLHPQSASMSPAQRSAIENATVAFFSHVISCHPQNQHQFALVLCEVIRASGE